MPKIYTNYFINVTSLTKIHLKLEWRAARSNNKKVFLFFFCDALQFREQIH